MKEKMMDVQTLFRIGMKRELGEILNPIDGFPTLELGPGNNPNGDVLLEFPAWDGSKDAIPYPDNNFGGVYAFHFLEHFTGEQVIALLREIERVLVPGGVLITCTPHRLGSMAFQDLDHKSFWTEDSWRVLFENQYYVKHRDKPWKFVVKFNMIAGINERNLTLLSCLQKVE